MDRDSALYFLVWHCGKSYDQAVAFLDRHPYTVKDLAESGRFEYRQIDPLFVRLIDKWVRCG